MSKQPKSVMVCVTRQKTCERLIRQGALLAQDMGCELSVVHAIHPNESVLGNPDEGAALEHLFEKAKEYGGEMSMLRADDTLEALAKCARDHNARYVIMGVSPQATDSIIDRLRSRLPGVDFIVIGTKSEAEGYIA
jgi:K+-sensing histidine kinase KdpD